METATSQVIGQLSGYMRGLTQRLDPGTGWYGEFLRRDPEGMRACLDGAAMPPWDVLESLLGDLAASSAPGALVRETQYAAGLRAAAVGVWDRLPGGVEELRTLIASAAEQRARARAALRVLSARLAETTDPAQAQALARELSWTRDDDARATARHEDLTARLEAALGTGRPSPMQQAPLNGVPAQRAATSPGAGPAAAWPGPREGMRPESPDTAAATSDRLPGTTPDATAAPTSGRPVAEGVEEPVRRAEGRWLRGARRSGGARYAGAATPEAQAVTMPPGQPSSDTPLRGARFGRPARPAAEPAPAEAPTGAAGQPDPARGARHEPANASSAGQGPEQTPAASGRDDYPGSGPAGGHSGAEASAEVAWSPASGRAGGGSGSAGQGGRPPGTPAWSAGYTPAAEPGPGPHPQAEPTPWPDLGRAGGSPGDSAQWPGSTPGGDPHGTSVPWAGAPVGPGSAPGGAPHGAPASWAGAPGASGGFVEGLVALRGQGRSGEAHVLLCEAAAGPAERLALLGEELRRAGLAADWATLLWEAASLPPARFAAAAAALGPADQGALLRQGAARPAAEIAEIALVLGTAGHTQEADALLAAFVRVRTAEESARLARRDPRWFAPRLLRAAEALSGAHHRDLLHALRVANLPVA
ncbi:hypothetical protein [Streptomyces sp. NPDC059957]|uniref:hypothetical protein n=1 Tax=unclassified Streptomyces TaxID=2593676 RepID=UPI00364ABBD9